MAVSHTIAELPLVVLLGGDISLEAFPEFQNMISIFGAVTLFVFTGMQIKTVFRKKELTLSNPEYDDRFKFNSNLF